MNKLKAIDITNNLFESFQNTVTSLSTLPLLENLTINLDTQDQVQYIFTNLPNITVLNNYPVSDSASESNNYLTTHNNNEEITLSEIKEENQLAMKNNEDLKSFIKKEEDEKIDKRNNSERTEIRSLIENAAKIFDDIKLNVKQLVKDIYTENFDNTLNNCINVISNKSTKSIYSKFSENMKAVTTLYELCFDKVIENISKTKTPFTKILEDIKKGYFSIINSLSEESAKSVSKSEIEFTKQQSKQVLTAAEQMENEMNKQLKYKDQVILQLEAKINEISNKNKELIEENEKCINTLIKHSREKANQILNCQNQSKSQLKLITPRDKIEKVEKIKTPIKEINKEIPPPEPNNNQQRVLTLKQLKDTIQDIYIQKQKFDEKCILNKLPKETMEQYMYTYLNQKFGLKKIILEQATSIMNGISNFSTEDNDVCLFGKILKNECDEEFRIIHNKLKITINDILKEKLKTKFKLKTEGEIIKMSKEITNGYIDEWLWKNILAKLYKEEHYIMLEEKVRQSSIQALNISDNDSNVQKVNKNLRLAFELFQKIILDYQLKSHEFYIKNFLQIFKKIDQDGNGIINEEEFDNLLIEMNICDDKIERKRLFNKIDKFNHNQINLSECIFLLNTETATVATENGLIKNETLLEKFLKIHS